MQQQVFRGSDVRDALSAVRSAFGSDAIIESTRQVSNGRGGMLGRSFVEITAAPGSSRPCGPFAQGIAMEPSASEHGPRRPRTRSVPQGSEPNRVSVVGSPNFAALQEQVDYLRTMLDDLYKSRPPRDQALAILYEMGIEGRVAIDLAKGAAKVARRGPDALRGWLARNIVAALRTQDELLRRPGPVLIACVGPTGAGKTTTLAKLAAKARLDLGKRVSVISLDTYRVGAVEQWQRYAELMGLPFGVARTPAMFESQLRHQNADVVLVDTAGRHGSESDTSWDLPEYFAQESQFEHHVLVVLPTWLSARDAEATTALYSRLKPSGTVFTKLDESRRAGGVVTATIQSSLPVTYLCDGPRVPEDIREASAEGIAAALFDRTESQ